MGTNYYLRRRFALKKYYDTHNGKLPFDIKILTNGFVWNDTYYSDLVHLESEYYQNLHIGKSSWGWLFLLQQYPYNPEYACFDELRIDDTFSTFEDYLNEIKKETTLGIFDEYGDELSEEDLINIVTRKDWKDFDSSCSPFDDTAMSQYKHLLYSKHDSALKCYNEVPYRVTDKGDFC